MHKIFNIFETNRLSPHGYGFGWDPLLLWVHALADGLIAASYFSIPVVLVVFGSRRRDISFSWVILPFGAFILLCGATHVLDVVSLWVPIYGVEGLVKSLTALVSVMAAIALWPLLSWALALPSSAGLRLVNDELAREVEQRRQAESALHDLDFRLETQMAERERTERRFRLLVDSVVDYGIFMLDPQGIVSSWNVGAERIKGYRASEIVGQSFTRFYTEADNAAGKPMEGLAIAKAEGRFHDEGWRVRKDGTRFWANVVITAIRDRDGVMLGFGKVTRDMTERRLAQQTLTEANAALESRVQERTQSLVALNERLEGEIAERKIAETTLRETTELLEATFDAAPFPIMVARPGGEILMWNKAGEATFGFAEGEMIAHGYQLLVPESRWREAEHVRPASLTGRVTIESQVSHRNGKMLDIRTIATPIFCRNRSVRAVVIVMEDLTQKNQTEAQLRQSQKLEAIGTLTGGMAHDFNNLLGIIIGNLDLLRECHPDDRDVMELSGEALEAAMRGADLTRRLLAFARRQPLQSRRLDLGALISATVKLLARLLGDDVEIALNLADDVCAVMADPAQLEAALTNLATNARDAMPKGGILTITTGHRTLEADYVAAIGDIEPGDYAVIEVTDSGTGMSEEVKSRIFEPFYTTKNERGTGLGLSMVFGFMKQSGGHISVYSEVGIGTTFRLYLPCSHEHEDDRLEPLPVGPLAGKGETVLAVEDNPALRQLVVRQLRGLGYRVLEAWNGVEAIEILNGAKVDLLLTDIVMPAGTDGFELAHIAARRWPDMKVILTSGFPQSRFQDDLGAISLPLLGKPYRKETLARMIRAMLDGTSLEEK